MKREKNIVEWCLFSSAVLDDPTHEIVYLQILVSFVSAKLPAEREGAAVRRICQPLEHRIRCKHYCALMD